MIDPTLRGDLIAEEVRAWYEAHRETWWDRHRPRRWRPGMADNFILELIAAVARAEETAPR